MEPRRGRGAPLRVDAVVLVLTVLAGVAVAVTRGAAGVTQTSLVAELCAQLVASGLLIWRKSRPGPVLVLTVVLSWISPAPAAVVAAYSLGRWRNLRSGAVWAAVAVVAGFPAGWFALDRGGVATTLLPGIVVVGCWLAGQQRRTEEEAASERLRARALAEERRVGQVRAAERVQLAREIHDVVAHRISYVVVRANLAELHATGPAIHEDLDVIRDSARAAMAELRGLFHDSSDEEHVSTVELVPSIAQVERWALEARAVGQPVRLEVDLVSKDPPDNAERTAVRVVREALTNAVRHAPGAPTEVRISDEGPVVRVVVSNDASVAPDPGVPSGGQGLQGIRERLRLVGGSAEIGPRPDGGFVVEARIPREAP